MASRLPTDHKRSKHVDALNPKHFQVSMDGRERVSERVEKRRVATSHHRHFSRVLPSVLRQFVYRNAEISATGGAARCSPGAN